MQAFILRAILLLAPGLGPFGAPLAIILSIFLSSEAKAAHDIALALIQEAEDPVRHPEFAGGGHGFQKFDWVFTNALKQLAAAQVSIIERDLSLIIESLVSLVKA